MSQEYTPTTWVDETSQEQGTLINAARLNNLEGAHHYADGFKEVDAVPTANPGVSYHQVVYCTADSTFYRWDGSAWTADIDDDTKRLLQEEITRATNRENEIAGDLSTEVTNRTNADTALGTCITNEATARGNADDAINLAVSAHIGDTSNPHEVTKAQIGLGNVDNTSDMNKPISTAVATALTDGSVTKVGTSTVGGATRPIYLDQGVPTAGNQVVDLTTVQTIPAAKTWTGTQTFDTATASDVTTGSLTVQNTATIASASINALSVSGSMNIASLTAGTISTSGAATLASAGITGTLTVSGNTALGDASISTASITTLTVSGTAAIDDANVTSATLGALTVTGATALASTTATSLGVSGNATVGGTLGVTGATTLSSLTASGNASVGGTLGVTGATTLAGLTAGTSTLGATTASALTVSGTSTLAATTATSLGVSGTSSFAGQADHTALVTTNDSIRFYNTGLGNRASFPASTTTVTPYNITPAANNSSAHAYMSLTDAPTSRTVGFGVVSPNTGWITSMLTAHATKGDYLDIPTPGASAPSTAAATVGWCADTTGLNSLLHKDGDETKTGVLTLGNNLAMVRGTVTGTNGLLFKSTVADVTAAAYQVGMSKVAWIDKNGVDIARLEVFIGSNGRAGLTLAVRNADGTYKASTLLEGDS